jgi:hypothetical protein
MLIGIERELGTDFSRSRKAYPRWYKRYTCEST